MQHTRTKRRPRSCDFRRSRWLGGLRDFETIDSELRLLAAVRLSIREHGDEPPSRQVDELLDERHTAERPSE